METQRSIFIWNLIDEARYDDELASSEITEYDDNITVELPVYHAVYLKGFLKHLAECLTTRRGLMFWSSFNSSAHFMFVCFMLFCVMTVINVFGLVLEGMMMSLLLQKSLVMITTIFPVYGAVFVKGFL